MTDMKQIELQPSTGRLLRFRNIDEVTDWFDKQRHFWSWVPQQMPNDATNLNQARAYPSNLLAEIHRHINNFNTKQGENEWNGLENCLRKNLVSQVLPVAPSKEANFLTKFAEDNGPTEAVAALAVMINQPWDYAKRDQMYGAFASMAFLQSISKRTVKSVEDSLDDLQRRYDLEIQSLADRASEQVESLKSKDEVYGELIDSSNKWSVKAKRVLVKLVRSERRKVDAKADAQRFVIDDEWQSLKERFRTELALEAPTKYWTDKRAKHRWSFVGVLALFFVYGVLVYCVGGWSVSELREGEVLKLSVWQNATWGMTALILLPLGVVVALGRLILKVAFSQLHLGNDADERVTMVKTYLALREGGHANDQQVALVVERLFASTADGIVREDVPLTPLSSLTDAVRR